MDVAENKGDVGRHQGVVGEEEDLRDEEPWRRSPKRTAVQWKDEQLGVTWKVHRLLGQMGYWTAMIRPPGELVGDLTLSLFLSEMRKFFPFLVRDEEVIHSWYYIEATAECGAQYNEEAYLQIFLITKTSNGKNTDLLTHVRMSVWTVKPILDCFGWL